MSACISRHGEYSAHTLGHANTPDEFVCSWCGAFDEDAARSEVDRLREALTLIADRAAPFQCETSTTFAGVCREPNSGRIRDSEYGYNQWCTPCVAADALEGGDQ